MSVTTFTSREINQDLARAKRATLQGPVFITDRGKPAHVLLSIDTYQRLTGERRSLVEALAMPGLSNIPLATPKTDIRVHAADLS